jgi:hypothetical protein
MGTKRRRSGPIEGSDCRQTVFSSSVSTCLYVLVISSRHRHQITNRQARSALASSGRVPALANCAFPFRIRPRRFVGFFSLVDMCVLLQAGTSPDLKERRPTEHRRRPPSSPCPAVVASGLGPCPVNLASISRAIRWDQGSSPT